MNNKEKSKFFFSLAKDTFENPDKYPNTIEEVLISNTFSFGLSAQFDMAYNFIKVSLKSGLKEPCPIAYKKYYYHKVRLGMKRKGIPEYLIDKDEIFETTYEYVYVEAWKKTLGVEKVYLLPGQYEKREDPLDKVNSVTREYFLMRIKQ